MTMRRKGEQKLPRAVYRWEPGGAIVGCIARGSHWFDAWLGQCCTPLDRLEKLSGLSRARLDAIRYDIDAEPADIAALARAWRTDSEDVAASIAAWRAKQNGPTCSE